MTDHSVNLIPGKNVLLKVDEKTHVKVHLRYSPDKTVEVFAHHTAFIMHSSNAETTAFMFGSER